MLYFNCSCPTLHSVVWLTLSTNGFKEKFLDFWWVVVVHLHSWGSQKEARRNILSSLAYLSCNELHSELTWIWYFYIYDYKVFFQCWFLTRDVESSERATVSWYRTSDLCTSSNLELDQPSRPFCKSACAVNPSEGLFEFFEVCTNWINSLFVVETEVRYVASDGHALSLHCMISSSGIIHWLRPISCWAYSVVA